MLINVNKISEKGYAVKDTIDIDTNALLEKESQFLEELNYQIFFKREGNRIKAQGKIKTAILIPCVRCLEPFEFKINSRFDIVLFPLEMVDQNQSGNLDAEEMEYIFYESDQIDVQKILIEQINLFIPVHPSCRENCKGICPSCGINLNHASCSCEPHNDSIKFSLDKPKR